VTSALKRSFTFIARLANLRKARSRSEVRKEDEVALWPRMHIVIIGAAILFGDVTTSVIVSAGRHEMSDIKGKWSGTLDQFSHDTYDTIPVELTVDSISGDEFTGTMEWPDNGCQTFVEGMFDGELIKWSETEYLKGDDVVLYGLYVAKFKADNEIVGEWMDPKHTINPKGPKFGVPGANFTLKKQ
jgi:hypothetical protein